MAEESEETEQEDEVGPKDEPEPEEPNDQEILQASTHLVYENALQRIRERVSGHDRLTQRLALAATQHIVAPEGGARLTLVGPSGSGKTTIARAMAAVTNRPFAELSMTDVVQTGWQGPQLSELLSSSLLHQAGALQRAGKGMVPDLIAEAILFLDEADKTAFGGFDGSARDHYLGKQMTILGLLGSNGRVLVGSDSIATNRMMIICAGVFAGLPDTPHLLPKDIEDLGFLHELVERMGVIHRLSPLTGKPLEAVLRKGLEPNLTTARAFGYDLEISDQVISYAAVAVAGGRGGPRSGVSWLRAAADSCLERLLEERAPAGTKITVSPDDVELGRVQPRSEAGSSDRPEEDPPAFL